MDDDHIGNRILEQGINLGAQQDRSARKHGTNGFLFLAWRDSSYHARLRRSHGAHPSLADSEAHHWAAFASACADIFEPNFILAVSHTGLRRKFEYPRGRLCAENMQQKMAAKASAHRQKKVMRECCSSFAPLVIATECAKLRDWALKSAPCLARPPTVRHLLWPLQNVPRAGTCLAFLLLRLWRRLVNLCTCQYLSSSSYVAALDSRPPYLHASLRNTLFFHCGRVLCVDPAKRPPSAPPFRTPPNPEALKASNLTTVLEALNH